MKEKDHDAGSVQQTFIEFWPASLLALALPHIAVPLTSEEFDIIKCCHRHGSPARLERAVLNRVAQRIAEAATVYPSGFFIRLGYGSWARTQLDRNKTLRLRNAQQVAEILSLQDRRLFEISQRFARNLEAYIFVRPFVSFDFTEERRANIQARRLIDIGPRHDEAGAQTTCEVPSNLLDEVARLMPTNGTYTVDFVPVGDGWSVVDLNPDI